MNNHQEASWRWDPYYLVCSECFGDFWNKLQRDDDRKVLFILGLGFDPRMCIGLKKILESTSFTGEIWLISYDEGEDSYSHQYKPLVEENYGELLTLVRDRFEIQKKEIPMWVDNGNSTSRRRIGSRNICSLFNKHEGFDSYSNILIDISSLPRGLYFPLVGSALECVGDIHNSSNGFAPNLHIVVCENSDLDNKIIDEGVEEDAILIPGFGSDIESEALEGIPTIWLPLLGERKAKQLEKIHNKIGPDEICPLLPFPSKNPRRADEIIIEYRELLFDRWSVERKNFIYASEQNPFEVYRCLCRVTDQFTKSLQPLGGCKVVISTQSSKLISLGALLAAYELKKKGYKVGVALVEAKGYRLETSPHARDEFTGTYELFSMWLSGKCYE